MIFRLLTAALLLLGLGPGSGAAARAQTAMNDHSSFSRIFPQGDPLPERFARYFIGQAYLAPLTADVALGVPVSHVTFEPSCRNNWHSHTGGQLLICTAGRGYYQEQGRPAVQIRSWPPVWLCQLLRQEGSKVTWETGTPNATSAVSGAR